MKLLRPPPTEKKAPPKNKEGRQENPQAPGSQKTRDKEKGGSSQDKTYVLIKIHIKYSIKKRI